MTYSYIYICIYIYIILSSWSEEFELSYRTSPHLSGLAGSRSFRQPDAHARGGHDGHWATFQLWPLFGVILGNQTSPSMTQFTYVLKAIKFYVL